MLPTDPPEHQLDISPPRWSEVQKTVHRAMASSAPGPNGVLYRLYKNPPDARSAALPLEAHEGCMAKPGVTNMLVEGWRNPYPKGKVLISRSGKAHMPPLPNPSNTQAQLGGLQDQFNSKTLHPAAQPGVALSCSSAGRSTGECEHPPSFLLPLADNDIHPGRRGPSQTLSLKTRCWMAMQGMRLEAVGRLRPEALLPSWDRVDKSRTRPLTMDGLTPARLHHWDQSALGGCSGGGLQTEKKLRKPSWQLMHKIEAGQHRSDRWKWAPSVGSARPVQSCRKGESVAVDEKRSPSPSREQMASKGWALDARIHRWTLWRCHGPISNDERGCPLDTPEDAISHLTIAQRLLATWLKYATRDINI